jgi:hypothetical protein
MYSTDDRFEDRGASVRSGSRAAAELETTFFRDAPGRAMHAEAFVHVGAL